MFMQMCVYVDVGLMLSWSSAVSDGGKWSVAWLSVKMNGMIARTQKGGKSGGRRGNKSRGKNSNSFSWCRSGPLAAEEVSCSPCRS